MDSAAGPDVVIGLSAMVGATLPAEAQSRYLDLKPYVDDASDFKASDYYMPAMDAGVVHGKRYFLPFSFDAFPIATTEETAKEYGFSAKKPPTLEQWVEIAKRAKEKTGEPLAYACLRGRQYFYYTALMSGCPTPVDQVARTANFDTKEFRLALDWLEELYQNQYDANHNADQFRMNMREKPWVEFALPPTGISTLIRHQPLPDEMSNPGSPVILLNGASQEGSLGLGGSLSVLAVNGKSNATDAAIAFVKTCMDPQVQSDVMAVVKTSSTDAGILLGSIPVNRQIARRALEETAASQHLKNAEALKQAETYLDGIQQFVFVEKKLQVTIDDEIERYVNGETDKDELIATLNEKVNAVLKE